MLLTFSPFVAYKARFAHIAHSVGNVQGWVILLVEFDELDGVLGVLHAEEALLDFSSAQVDVVGDGPTGEGRARAVAVVARGQVEFEDGFFLDSGDVAQVLDGVDLARVDRGFNLIELVFGEGESSDAVEELVDDVEKVLVAGVVHGDSPRGYKK